MIIDLILDRKDGIEYNAKQFYLDVREYEDIFELGYAISKAMDYGTNLDIRKALCDYIEDNGYNHEIKDYVNSQKWI